MHKRDHWVGPQDLAINTSVNQSKYITHKIDDREECESDWQERLVRAIGESDW
jgi:hypothetical protein